MNEGCRNSLFFASKHPAQIVHPIELVLIRSSGLGLDGTEPFSRDRGEVCGEMGSFHHVPLLPRITRFLSPLRSHSAALRITQSRGNLSLPLTAHSHIEST